MSLQSESVNMNSEQSSKTNFEMVVDFNTSFGVPLHKTPQFDIFKKDPKLLAYRLSLIDEEVKELHDAVVQEDFTESIDALADILYVVYGAFTAMGVDADLAYQIVHKSNMSKLCTSEDEAKQTVEWYKANEKRYDSPSYRKSACDKYWVIFNESTGKVLKNINYTPANFSTLFKVPAKTN
jgi:predicted HAD superfamily Cof-like phosphohydrolase